MTRSGEREGAALSAAAYVEPSAEMIGLGEPVTAGPQDSPEHHVRAALDRRLRVLLSHDPGTRTGEDPEDLHQVRVSVRRMRAVLRAARPLLDRGWADRLRGELGWLGGTLGPVRDLDVLLAHLHEVVSGFGAAEQAAAEPLFTVLTGQRQAARSTLLDALTSARYLAVLRMVAGAAGRPVPVAADHDRPSLIDLVRAEYDTLRRAVHAAGEHPADVALHALRIHGKRLRYTTELAEPALGEPAKALLGATTAMQDVLGAHQDACVAIDRVHTVLTEARAELTAKATAGLIAAVDHIVELEAVRRADTRAGWPPAWAQVRRTAEQLR